MGTCSAKNNFINLKYIIKPRRYVFLYLLKSHKGNNKLFKICDINTKLTLLKRGEKGAKSSYSSVLQKKMCIKLINSYTVYKKTLNTTKCMKYQHTFIFLKKRKKALCIRALQKKFLLN